MSTGSDTPDSGNRRDASGRWYFRERYAALGEPREAHERLMRWYAGFMRYLYRHWGDWIPQQGVALDVGCGYGVILTLLEQHGFETYGTDVSAYAVDAVRDLRPDWSDRVVVSNLQKERPFADRSFDLVVAVEVLEHLSDPAKGLEHVLAALRPGGTFVMTTPNPRVRIPPYDPFGDPTHVSVLELDHWRKQLSRAGFSSIASETFLHLPLLHRLSEKFSVTIPTWSFGPGLILLARRAASPRP